MNPVCNICSKPAKLTKTNRLVLDHNHASGEIRGFLCDFCNARLYMYERVYVEKQIFKGIKKWIKKLSKWIDENKIDVIEAHLNNHTGIYYSSENNAIARELLISRSSLDNSSKEIN